MGFRLHAATTYKVRYGTGHFNQQQEETNRLLSDLCPSAWFDCDEIDFSTEIEVDKLELEECIKRLRAMSDEDFSGYTKDKDLSREDVAEILEGFLNEADKENNYVKLSWF